MNPRTLGIVALVVVAAVAGVAGAVYMMATRVSPARLAEYQSQLNDPSAAVRLDAATALLKANPDQEEVALIRARALLQLGRYPAARETLRPFRQLDRAHVIDSLYLTGESYLREAADKIARETPATIDNDDDSLRATLIEVEPIAVMLLSMDETQTRVLGLELRARKLDQDAKILRVILRAKALQVNAAPAEGEGEQPPDTTAADVHKLEEDLKALEDGMVQAASGALQLAPSRGWPRVLLAQQRLRDGDAQGAREEATEAIAQPTIERLAAGAIADGLLDIENRTGLPRQAGDVELASKLINHPGITGDPSIEFMLAQVRLAFEAGNYAEAERLARATLAQNEGNPTAMAMLGDAMTASGRYKETLALLEPFCERVRSAVAREALARAYVAQFQKEGITATNLATRNVIRIDPRDNARTSLRIALNIDPTLLSARFMLTDMFLEGGTRENYAAAEGELYHIVRQAPKHPRQLAIRTRLILERLDAPGLTALIDKRLGAGAPPLKWRDLAIAAAMVLDDRDAVQQLDREALAAAPDDTLGLIGEAWRQGSAMMRVQMAGVTIRALDDRLEPGPMDLAEAPPLPLARPTAPPAPANRPTPTTSSIERFANPRYIPWSHATALAVLDVGMERFGSPPQLLELSAQMAMWLGRLDDARQRCAALDQSAAGQSDASLTRAMRFFLDGDDAQALATISELRASPRASRPSVAFIEMAANLRQHNLLAADRALDRLLAEHLWLELAVNYAQRQALIDGDFDRAFRLAEKLNPESAGVAMTQPAARRQTSAPPIYHLCRARLFAALGQYELALAEVKDALSGEPIQSELRRLCAEVVAASNGGGDLSNASTQFQTLSVTVTDQRMPLQICALDAAIEFEQESPLVETSLDRLIDSQTPPRYLDQVLARAITLMPASRLNNMLDRVLLSRPDDAVALLYRAQALEDSEPERAETMLRSLVKRFKGAPRPQMALAGLLARQGRVDEARSLYGAVVEAGGRGAVAARRALASLPAGDPATNAVPPADAPADSHSTTAPAPRQ